MQIAALEVSKDANSVPGFPQHAFMEGPMMAMDKMVDKPENFGLRPGWSGSMAGMMTFVRVLPPDKYDHIMELRQKKKRKEPMADMPGMEHKHDNQTTPLEFVDKQLGARALRVFAIRFVLLILSPLLLIAWPSQAQTPASEQKTITLEELQQMPLKNNPTGALSAANIQAAEGRKKQSGL